jgi:hypothetical protein
LKYVLRIHGRTAEDVPAERRHDHFVRGIRRLPAPWGLPDLGNFAFPGFGRDMTAIFPLPNPPKGGWKGRVTYRYRRLLTDSSSDDDFVDVSFNPQKADFEVLIEDVFPRYIQAFGGYFGYIGDEEFIHIDFDRSRGFNKRTGVLRMYPVTFLDGELCKRAFGLSAAGLMERLNGAGLSARSLGDGLVLVAHSGITSIPECEQLEITVRRLVAAV